MIFHRIKKGIVFHGSGGLLFYYMGSKAKSHTTGNEVKEVMKKKEMSL